MKRNIYIVGILCFLLCVTSLAYAKVRSHHVRHYKRSKKILDILPYYTKYKNFTQGKCFYPRKKLVCAHRDARLRIYAEQETADSYRLTIMVRRHTNQTFSLYIYEVVFNKTFGIRVTDISEYYDTFHETKHNVSLPLSLRLWLIHIQESIEPTYVFTPLKKKPTYIH